MKFQQFKDEYARKLNLGYNDFDDLITDGKRQNIFAIEAHLNKAADNWLKAELRTQREEIADDLIAVLQDMSDKDHIGINKKLEEKGKNVQIRWRCTKFNIEPCSYAFQLALREVGFKVLKLKPEKRAEQLKENFFNKVYDEDLEDDEV